MPLFGGEQELPDISLHDLLWDSMGKYGNSTAFVDATTVEKSITYSELYSHSRRCAAYLQSIGIKKGDFVAICAFGSLEFIYVMIGILGCGATVTPCNPNYRKNEILQQFAISSPKLAFVDNETVETMTSVKSDVSSLQNIVVMGDSTEFMTLAEILNERNADSLEKVDINTECDVAFVPHSSGTTGFPKCAMMTHKNYVSTTLIRSCCFPPDFLLSLYCDRAMYHSGGFISVFASIVGGFKTIIEKEFHLQKMFQDIDKYKITGAFCIPPILIEMVNTTENEKYDLSSLKVVTSGGAGHPPDIIKRLIKKYKVQFLTDYGLTEVDALSLGMVLEDDIYGLSGEVQKGVEVKIVDIATEKECAAGVSGEVRVRSPQVTKGYLSSPGATTAAFDQDGWFRTGDIGFTLTDGKLYIIDRLREVIKCNALQVSPAELESVIISHPKVEDVGVIGIPDELRGEVPKAFVVPGDSEITASDVHAIVNENLAQYKQLRGGVEFVESIPKSLTGKIQRNVLKKMAGL